MRKLGPVVLAAGIVAAWAADASLAGQVAKATGPVEVNGKAVDLSQPVSLKAGDRVATTTGTAVFRSDSGDEIVLGPGTVVRHEGVEGGTEYLLVERGTATGKLGEKTSLGAASAWATAPKGARTEVRVEVPADRATTEGRFRAIGDGTWLRNANHAVWLSTGQSVTLNFDKKRPGDLCFRTAQQNEGDVELVRSVGGGDIRVRIPRASSGCVQDHPGNKTRISNDITSNKQAKVNVQTEFGARGTAAIGPGTFALIDNSTGSIETFQEFVETDVGEEPADFDPIQDSSDVSQSRRSKR